MRVVAASIAVVLLALMTQVGAAILLFCLLVARFFRLRMLATFALFAVTYALATVYVVPPLASLGGRVPLTCSGGPLRTLPLLCALNRHYVSPRLSDMGEALAEAIAAEYPGTITIALDANFPFFDGFPLLPHLSHDDGRKLDFAYAYAGSDGTYRPGATRSPIGYWAFEQPAPGEETDCPAEAMTARWDMDWLQPLWPDLRLEPTRTRATLQWLFSHGSQYGLERVFVEPYLAARLGAASPFLGFQGCRAARHDDHVHVQITG